MYYFIINPQSGSGHGRSVWQIVKAKLDQQKVTYKACVLSKPGEATKLSEAISSLKKPVMIVVLGGDGTIDEVINGIRNPEHVTFACIPTGSGNDFVRGLGLERDPLKALDKILNQPKIRPLNVGKVTFQNAKSADSTTVHSYIVSSGIGFDAAVCESVDASVLKNFLNRFRSGKLVYLSTALWQLLTMKRQTLTVTTDDGQTQIYKDAYFAASMNLPFEGGGFKFCPNAKPDDDALDIFIAQGIPRLKALCILPLAFPGKHAGFKGVHILHCKKAEITSPEPLCLHSDGEVIGYSKQICYELHEQKLNVIITKNVQKFSHKK